MGIPSWLLFLIIVIGGGALAFIMSPPTFVAKWFIRDVLRDETVDENKDKQDH